MSIRPISTSVQQLIPSNPFSGKYSLNLPRIASNLNTIAIPAVALFTLGNIPGADGGPLTYAACCLACTAYLPPLVPACLTLCLVGLFSPSP